MAEKVTIPDTIEVGENGELNIEGLPGNVNDLVKSFVETQSLVGKHATEIDTTKKQLDQALSALSSVKGQGAQPAAEPAPEPTRDFDAELTEVTKQMGKLDVDDPDYSKNLAALNQQQMSIVAEKVQTQTSSSLMGEFEKTLKQQDTAKAEQAWKDANPDFETPEMQQAIQQHIAQDRTGMMDPVLAYRELQLVNSQNQVQELQTQNEDFRRRLELKAGEEEVGKVTTNSGGGTPPAKPTKKLEGAELEKGALEAFRSAS